MSDRKLDEYENKQLLFFYLFILLGFNVVFKCKILDFAKPQYWWLAWLHRHNRGRIQKFPKIL